MSQFELITAVRDLLQIREHVRDMRRADPPLISMEQSAAIVHLVNTYLDQLLAPYIPQKDILSATVEQ